MIKNVVIGEKVLGDSHHCFIIAEAGVNHNGNINCAKKLIEVAADAKVDAVKFQTFKTENLVTKTTKTAEYQHRNTGESSYYEMIKNLELSKEQFRELKEYAESKGLVFMSTPAGKEDTDELYELGIKLCKVDSSNLTNIPHLEHMAKKGLPMIISTGMANLGDIEEALEVVYKTGNQNIILLHCTADYPPDVETVNLQAIQTLRQAFQVPVGYSDHTLGISVAIAAVALGACVIEKHITLDKTMKGPDHKVSLEPHELKELVQAIRTTEKAMGTPIKMPTTQEKKNMTIMRKSMTSKKNIKKGTIITEDMITIKRPGDGIPPKYVQIVIGRTTRRDIPEDTTIKWEDV